MVNSSHIRIRMVMHIRYMTEKKSGHAFNEEGFCACGAALPMFSALADLKQRLVNDGRMPQRMLPCRYSEV